MRPIYTFKKKEKPMTNVNVKLIHAAIEMDQPEVDVLLDWEIDHMDDAQEV